MRSFFKRRIYDTWADLCLRLEHMTEGTFSYVSDHLSIYYFCFETVQVVTEFLISLYGHAHRHTDRFRFSISMHAIRLFPFGATLVLMIAIKLICERRNA